MIKPLTSIRFLFALLVFGHHLIFINVQNSAYYKIYNSIFKEGFIGVSFFFILSGFILALNYKHKIITEPGSAKEFWISRIARIYPLHLFTLLIALPLSFSGLINNVSLWTTTLVKNTLLIQSFSLDSSIFFSLNAPSWSISNEIFFYLLFPLIIVFLIGKGKQLKFAWVALIIVPVGIYFCPEHLQHSIFYINPFMRFFDFLLGILLFEVFQSQKFKSIFASKIRATWVEIVSVLAIIIFYSFHSFLPIGFRYSVYYWLPISVFIFVFAHQSGFISKILSTKVFVLLGEISFSFYLIHTLVIRYVIFLNKNFAISINDYLLIGIIFVLTIVFSYFTYTYIEKPYYKSVKRKLKNFSVFIRIPLFKRLHL